MRTPRPSAETVARRDAAKAAEDSAKTVAVRAGRALATAAPAVEATRDSLWRASAERGRAADDAARRAGRRDATLDRLAVEAGNVAAEAFGRRVEAMTAVSRTAVDSAEANVALLTLRAGGGAATGDAADTIDLRFARRTVIFQPDPTLTALVKGLGKALSITGPSDTPKLDDSVKAVVLRQMSTDTSEQIWMGFQRFSLVENSVVELALTPSRPKQFPETDAPRVSQLLNVYGNLANARERRFELGILAGMTYGRRIPTYDGTLQVTAETSPTAFNGYLTAVMNAGWFSVPRMFRQRWRRASAGVFLGTNVLNGTVGEQPIAGVTLGHLLGDAGFSAGAAFLQEPELHDGRVRSRRRPRALYGIDLRF
jgi:hypothetical protein